MFRNITQHLHMYQADMKLLLNIRVYENGCIVGLMTLKAEAELYYYYSEAVSISRNCSGVESSDKMSAL